MSDHRHESYDVYGLDGTRQDAREALSLAAGLREDLGRTEERIAELEGKVANLTTALDTELRRLWTHISNMPGGI
jgi:hypothetical protein